MYSTQHIVVKHPKVNEIFSKSKCKGREADIETESRGRKISRFPPRRHVFDPRSSHVAFVVE
jgi:hypothetical protein